jgi:hypothetical protein
MCSVDARQFSGAFAKLRKTLLALSCPSVRLSLCLSGSHWTDFHEIRHTPALVHPHPLTHPPKHTQTVACTHTHLLNHARSCTHAHIQKYVILTAFHGNRGFVNAPRCYVDTYIACLLSYSVLERETRHILKPHAQRETEGVCIPIPRDSNPCSPQVTAVWQFWLRLKNWICCYAKK